MVWETEMTDEIVKLFINYGGAAVVLGAVIYLVRELSNFRNGNHVGKQISSQLTKIESNHLHTLQESIDRLSINMDRQFDRLNERLGTFLDRFGK